MDTTPPPELADLRAENRRLRDCLHALSAPDLPRCLRLEWHISSAPEDRRVHLIATWPHGTPEDERAMGEAVAQEFAKTLGAVINAAVETSPLGEAPIVGYPAEAP